VTFIENLTRNVPITHVFYEDVTERLRIGFGIEPGTRTYSIAIYYGGPFPLGEYNLRLFWGEIGIAVCMFSVVPDEQGTCLRQDLMIDRDDVPPDCRFEMNIE
jgi:hypothetical protein